MLLLLLTNIFNKNLLPPPRVPTSYKFKFKTFQPLNTPPTTIPSISPTISLVPKLTSTHSTPNISIPPSPPQLRNLSKTNTLNHLPPAKCTRSQTSLSHSIVTTIHHHKNTLITTKDAPIWIQSFSNELSCISKGGPYNFPLGTNTIDFISYTNIPFHKQKYITYGTLVSTIRPTK